MLIFGFLSCISFLVEKGKGFGLLLESMKIPYMLLVRGFFVVTCPSQYVKYILRGKDTGLKQTNITGN